MISFDNIKNFKNCRKTPQPVGEETENIFTTVKTIKLVLGSGVHVATTWNLEEVVREL